MADVDVLIRLQSGGESTSSPRWAGDLISYKVRPHAGWGVKEGLPMYGVLTITDADIASVQTRLKRHHREYEADKKTIKFIVRASHWINLNLLTEGQQQQLLDTGALTMSATEFYSRCNDRVAALRSL